jgi:hypothetical protein
MLNTVNTFQAHCTIIVYSRIAGLTFVTTCQPGAVHAPTPHHSSDKKPGTTYYSTDGPGMHLYHFAACRYNHMTCRFTPFPDATQTAQEEDGIQTTTVRHELL